MGKTWKVTAFKGESTARLLDRFDYFAIKYCLSRNISKLNKVSPQLKRDQARIIKHGII